MDKYAHKYILLLYLNLFESFSFDFSLASERFSKKVLICHNYGHGGAGK